MLGANLIKESLSQRGCNIDKSPYGNSLDMGYAKTPSQGSIYIYNE